MLLLHKDPIELWVSQNSPFKHHSSLSSSFLGDLNRHAGRLLQDSALVFGHFETYGFARGVALNKPWLLLGLFSGLQDYIHKTPVHSSHDELYKYGAEKLSS